MIILRIFLYLICIISITWSILVFGGPPIIKRLISGFSNGALMPSGIVVSSNLDINIRRLDFILQSQIAGRPVEGFSRAAELEWSIFGKKPFIKLKFGPSFVRDYATVSSVNFHTPSFQKLDWSNIAIEATIDDLALNSVARTHSLNLAGILNLENAKVSNLTIEFKKFSAAAGGPTYSAGLIRGKLNDLNLNNPINKQLHFNAFKVKDIVVSDPYLTAPEATSDFSFSKYSRNFRIDCQDVKLAESGAFLSMKFMEAFTQLNTLKDLKIEVEDGTF